MQNVNDIHQVVRERLFARLPAGLGVCFSYFQTQDAGPAQLGELFHQDADFLLFEVVIDSVRRAGPGKHTHKKVRGGIELSLHTKDQLDLVGLEKRLEDAGNWFAEETIGGVRFREFFPTGLVGRDRGFQYSGGTVPFEFETQPKHMQ